MFFKKSRKKYIYALRRLDNDKYVYIGQSYNPESRLLSHIRDAISNRHTNKKLQEWILRTIKINSMIVIDILEEVNENIANHVEKEYILEYKSKKHRLFNITDPTSRYERI